MTQQFILRAMAKNYAVGNSWDHLDAETCIKAADEIERLGKESQTHLFLADQRQGKYCDAMKEIERLRSQLEKAKRALTEIQTIGERSATFSDAIRPGNIAHAALISLTDD